MSRAFKLFSTFFTIFVTALLAVFFTAAPAYAEPPESDVAEFAAGDTSAPTSGVVGTCTWEIDPNGVLVLNPQTGVDTGVLQFEVSYEYPVIPWKNVRKSIYGFRCDGPIQAVGSLKGMFEFCTYLKVADFSNFDTSAVTDMGDMFRYCKYLAELDLSMFDTGSVNDMSRMFENNTCLKNLNISSFDTLNCCNMRDMFDNCSMLDCLDVSHFVTTNVVDMYGMFSGCSSLQFLQIDSFDTTNVTDMGFMFNECSSLSEVNVSSFNTQSCTNMGGMFGSCSHLTSLDLSSFTTALVTDFGNMFEGCSSLSGLDVSSFDTSSSVIVFRMFKGCESLESIDISNFDLSGCVDLYHLFQGCSSLQQVELPDFKDCQIKSMNSAFAGCKSLGSISFVGIEDSKLFDLNYLFDGCTSLSSLDLSCFDTQYCTDNMNRMLPENGVLSSITFGSTFLMPVTNVDFPIPGQQWTNGAIVVNSTALRNMSANDLQGTWERLDSATTEQFTVTYTDGCAQNAFENQSYTVNQGVSTPMFQGVPNRIGYVFTGWSPEVTPTVQKDVTYVAQWEKLVGCWEQDQYGNWKYILQNGEYATGLVPVNGDLYHFDSSGVMTTGWYQDNDGTYYYFSDTGYGKRGWEYIGSTWYCFDDDCKMMVGHNTVSSWPVYFESWGGLHTGWLYEDGIYHYYDDGGWMVFGWQYINGNYYYFDMGTGIMATGVKDIKRTYSVFASGGQLQYGWSYVDGKYYYSNGSGYCVTGWEYINGNYYYFSPKNSVMATGLVQGVNGNDYLFADWGGMRYGWQKATNPVTGVTEDVYCTDSGALLKNAWKGWYYLGPDGFMLKNAVTPDGWCVNGSGYATEWVG